jgi:hypothetical protein
LKDIVAFFHTGQAHNHYRQVSKKDEEIRKNVNVRKAVPSKVHNNHEVATSDKDFENFA